MVHIWNVGKLQGWPGAPLTIPPVHIVRRGSRASCALSPSHHLTHSPTAAVRYNILPNNTTDCPKIVRLHFVLVVQCTFPYWCIRWPPPPNEKCMSVQHNQNFLILSFLQIRRSGIGPDVKLKQSVGCPGPHTIGPLGEDKHWWRWRCGAIRKW